MDDNQRKARIDRRRLEEIAHGDLGLWWQSFADEDGFKGVVILEAYGPADAMCRSHEVGLNPGGEIQAMRVPYEDHPEALRNRLLKKSDLTEIGISSREIG